MGKSPLAAFSASPSVDNAITRPVWFLVIAIPDLTSAELLVKNAPSIKPKLDIVARVHSDSDASALLEIVASEIVQPEFEAGLEIVHHTLHRSG